MPNPLRSLTVVCILLALSGSARAQDLNWAQKMFKELEHDFGVVARGADVRHRIKVKNLYKETVHISNVRTTCGCAAASPEKTTLESLEETYVEVTMNTTRFQRQKDSNVIVTFDSPLYAEVRIPIHAYIRTDVVLTPGSANFGPIDRGNPASRSLDIAYAGRSSWEIQEVKADNPNIETHIEEVGRDPGRVHYKLQVELKPSAPAGVLREQITLVTNDINNPYVPVLVEARIEADITVTPDLVALGALNPGRDKRFNVVLKGKKPFVIENIECDSDMNAFKVQIPDSAKIVHVLPMTVTAPDEPGKLDEVFTVTIADHPEPVTFRAYGTVVATQAAANAN